jgi:hypothetical protein
MRAKDPDHAVVEALADPVDPVDPVDSVAPVAPVAPVDPVDPVDSVAPVVDSAAPADLALAVPVDLVDLGPVDPDSDLVALDKAARVDLDRVDLVDEVQDSVALAVPALVVLDRVGPCRNLDRRLRNKWWKRRWNSIATKMESSTALNSSN